MALKARDPGRIGGTPKPRSLPMSFVRNGLRYWWAGVPMMNRPPRRCRSDQPGRDYAGYTKDATSGQWWVYYRVVPRPFPSHTQWVCPVDGRMAGRWQRPPGGGRPVPEETPEETPEEKPTRPSFPFSLGIRPSEPDDTPPDEPADTPTTPTDEEDAPVETPATPEAVTTFTSVTTTDDEEEEEMVQKCDCKTGKLVSCNFDGVDACGPFGYPLTDITLAGASSYTFEPKPEQPFYPAFLIFEGADEELTVDSVKMNGRELLPLDVGSDPMSLACALFTHEAVRYGTSPVRIFTVDGKARGKVDKNGGLTIKVTNNHASAATPVGGMILAYPATED